MKKNIIIPFACLVFANLFSHTVLAGGGGGAPPPPEYQWCIKNTTNENIKYHAQYIEWFLWHTAYKSGWIGPTGRSCFNDTHKPMYTLELQSKSGGSCLHEKVAPGEYKVTRVINDWYCHSGNW